jgi:lysyl-tRNA synthetase, class II
MADATPSLPPLDEPGLSKTELKRRKKAHEKAAKKGAASNATASEAVVDEATLSARDYTAFRTKMLEDWQTKGVNPWPHKFHVSISVPDFLAKFDHLKDEEESSEEVSVAGRVMLIRASSKKLAFYDLHADGVKVQIMANFRNFEDAEGVRKGSLGPDHQRHD